MIEIFALMNVMILTQESTILLFLNKKFCVDDLHVALWQPDDRFGSDGDGRLLMMSSLMAIYSRGNG